MRAYYRSQAEDADRMYRGGAARDQRSRLDLTRRLLDGIPFEGANVVDLGSGDGYAASVIFGGQCPRTYVAIDLSPLKLGRLRRRLSRPRAVLADAQALPLADGSAGLVLCLETLEHLEDPLASAREIRRILGDPGIAVVSVPVDAALQRLWNRLRRLLPWRYKGFEEHIQLFTSRGLKDMAEGAGFRLLALRYCGFRLPILSLLSRLLPYRWYAALDRAASRIPIDHFGVGGRVAKLQFGLGRRYAIMVLGKG